MPSSFRRVYPSAIAATQLASQMSFGTGRTPRPYAVASHDVFKECARLTSSRTPPLLSTALLFVHECHVVSVACINPQSPESLQRTNPSTSPPEMRSSEQTLIATMPAATLLLTNANRAAARESLVPLTCVEQSRY
eukprot:6202858-Pleurochrysis_carterae.AAC.1